MFKFLFFFSIKIYKYKNYLFININFVISYVTFDIYVYYFSISYHHCGNFVVTIVFRNTMHKEYA